LELGGGASSSTSRFTPFPNCFLGSKGTSVEEISLSFGAISNWWFSRNALRENYYESNSETIYLFILWKGWKNINKSGFWEIKICF
jgi:hypothetical protein